MTWSHRRGLRHHVRRVATHHAKHHRGHPMSAVERKKLSAREKGRHHPHKGHKATAKQRAADSKRAKGRKHPHRGVKGHHHHEHHRKATKRKTRLKRRPTHHRTTRPHRSTGRTHRTARRAGGTRHVARTSHRVARARRGRIYPSHFGARRRRLHSRFNHRKRIRALRAPYVAGRRHVRAWK
jgi:hypothetical protein